MYSGSGFSDWEIGDITVIIHKGIYHLYHLIIPNHDYIAHAISEDGISWKRVNNALFVGQPGEWDDDMLWTMHVVESGSKFEMYYTGLQRKDRGVISRIGYAESKNLIDWQKNNNVIFPIEPDETHYETPKYNDRTWISFRDPFRFDYNNESYLLVCARARSGPISRRGCVGVIKITNDQAVSLPPLLFPMVYDDIECPCVFELNNRFYLIGSIREDVKVRYWFAPDFFGEYHSFHNDVLLPQGNYAARIVKDGKHLLIFNFFYTHGKIDSLRALPPPKELYTDEIGRLVLKSYYRWKEIRTSTLTQQAVQGLRQILYNPTATFSILPEKWSFTSKSGYEIFCFPKPSNSFIWEGQLTVDGMGKLGLVTDMDYQGNGYFISFDVVNGLVQIRAWGFNSSNSRQNFIFTNLQSNNFHVNGSRKFQFTLIRYGHYIELAINDVVKLTLVDYTYTGTLIGLYTASSAISLEKAVLSGLPDPREEYGSQKEAQIN